MKLTKLSKLRILKKRLLYIAQAVLFAWGLFTLTQIIFANSASVLAATVSNMVTIVIFIVAEKVEYYILARLIAQKKAGKNLNIFSKVLVFYLSGASFKSGMYFFYIVVTVYTAIIAAEPDFGLQFSYEYVMSVRYGILFLIAVDKFSEQVFKDIKNDDKILKNQQNQENQE